jgi:hypothetical protein
MTETWLRNSVVVFSLLLGTNAHAVTISGIVQDKHTSLPVGGAKVTLLHAGVSGTTDSAGRFSLSSSSSASGPAEALVVTDERYWEKKVPVTASDTSNLKIELQAAKQRLIITTDIGGDDPDDQESMIHALMLSNEFELEGIIYGHSWTQANLNLGRQRIDSFIAAYEKVLPNLGVHAEGYPEPAFLRSIVKQGQGKPCMAGTGEGKDSDGSNLIIDVVLKKDDPRPVWLNVWGGANTIAQAYWKVKNKRTPEEVATFVRKVRVYDVLGQCDSGSWIAKHFPDSTYIRNADGVYGWAPSKAWTAENIQSHGPMGKAYPSPKYAVEGDSPAFFHVSSRGLNDPNELAQGGWGGRFGPEKQTGVKLFSWAEKTASVSANDKLWSPYALYTNTAEGIAPINKWKNDIHNGFAARMDWSVQSKRSEANHFPVAVLNGDTTMQILEMVVAPGQQVTLDASASSDPDGNKLQYSWQYYKESSSYNGDIAIQGDTSPTAKVTVPSGASGKSVHIILVLHDDGSPSLHAYRRMILNVKYVK